MDRVVKKTIKYTLIGIGVMTASFAIVAAIVLNIVFTPEKITPIALDAINRELNAEVHAERISLTFFATFPNVSFEVKKGSVVSRLDSIGRIAGNDSLLTFDACYASFNLMAFLQEKKIAITQIRLERPVVKAVLFAHGAANWDILKAPAPGDSTVTPTDTARVAIDLNIDDISIRDGDVLYEDQGAQLRTHVRDLDIMIRALANKDVSQLQTSVTAGRVAIWHEGNSLGSDVSLGISTQLRLDKKAKQLQVGETTARINDIAFGMSGNLVRVPERKLHVDLNVTFEAPTLAALVDLVPETIFRHADDFHTTGTVALRANIKGNYGSGDLPVITAGLSVKGGSLQYKERPSKIKLLEADVQAFIDPAKAKPTTVTVNHFKIEGTSTSLTVSGTGHDLLGQASLDGKLSGKINFAALANSLPLQQGIAMKGMVNADLKGACLLQHIMNKDYGKLDLRGKLVFSNTRLAYRTDSLVFEAPHFEVVFGQAQNSTLLTDASSKVLGGVVRATNLRSSVKGQFSFRADSLYAGFGSTPWRDTTTITTVRSSVKLKNANLVLADTLKAMAGRVTAKLTSGPSKENKRIPAFHTAFSIDSVMVRAKGHFLGIKEGDYVFDIKRKGEKQWPARGHITFKQVYLYSSVFPKLIKVRRTKVVVKPGVIELKNARVGVGDTDLQLTGKVYRLANVIRGEEPLKAHFALRSKVINANELIAILNKGSRQSADTTDTLPELVEQTPESADTASLKSFVLPRGLDLEFESSVGKVLFGHLEINDVKGKISVKDQDIHLSKLNMNTMAAKMATSLRYSARDTTHASMDFDFMLTDIDMANLVTLMPALDTLFPMARAFEGKVDFLMQGKADLDAHMQILLPSLHAIARVKGQNLVILDSETFAQLSKTLMFKNKERNMVDSASFEMIIEDNAMEILPSMVTVDRYQVAIGGQHKLDMTYAYHLSILKSPMPFKAGIDLLGDLEDYRIKITNAKYKPLFSDKKRLQEKADSVLIKKKQAILKSLSF